jgi:dolichyl-phosphate-mannose--protein O-mannosyl transferase
VPFNVSDLKLTETAVPGFSVAWMLREFLGFARNEPTPSENIVQSPTSKTNREPFEHFDIWIPAVIAICFYLLAIWRLSTPNEQVFDEVHHARTAAEYVHGLNPHEWSHPPFSKEMMALSLKAWGGTFDPRDGVWTPNQKFGPQSVIGWRFASVVFGTLTLHAVYALARVLSGRRVVAAAAAIMLAMDGVFFVHSRIAMTNIFTVFFITVTAVGVALFLQRQQVRWLLLTGVGLGFAIASRWSSLYAWAITIALLFGHWLFLTLQRRSALSSVHDEPTPLRPAKFLGAAFLCLVVVPFFIYFATYIPNVLQGPGSAIEKLFTFQGLNNQGWEKMFSMQKDMFNYHATLKASHPYDSPWWSWPLVLRPVWYFFGGKNGTIAGIWAIGNVFIWWASVPAFVTLLYMALREKGARTVMPYLLLVAYGVGLWLAWGVKSRALNFMHYYFECIPFACIALAYLGWRMWVSESGSLATRRLRRVFVGGYAVALGAWFIFYYPLLSAYPISDWYYNQHLWLGRAWV